jgi:hypothetical protein
MVVPLSHRSSREQRVFLSQVLANIRLSERNDTRGVKFPCLSRRPCAHSKALRLVSILLSYPTLYSMRKTYQRRIIHTQHHDTLMLRTVLTPPSHMRLEHIAPIQERHLAVLLDPHLVPCVRRYYAQRCDVQSELSGLGELSKADAEGEEVVACDGCGEVGERFADVVDT